MQALDELVARWRKNPDSESTLALCAHLGTSREAELMREVGNTAEAWHRDNTSVMLSVGRMYLDAGLLAEAQASFVQAGKLAPSDSAPYRFLGEVLLRRGDAVRGEKALARGIKLGDASAETRLWHERAVLYSGLQQRKGLGAVAEQVARVVPREPSIPAPTLSPFEAGPSPGPPRAARRSRPPGAPARPSGPRRSAPPAAARRRQSTPPIPLEVHKSAPQETLMMGRSPVPLPSSLQPPEHPPSPFFPSESHSPRARASGRVSQPLGTKLPNLLPKDAPGRTLAATKRNPVADPSQRFFPESVPPLPDLPAPEVASADAPASDPFRGTFSAAPRGSAASSLGSVSRGSGATRAPRDVAPSSEATVTETSTAVPSLVPLALLERADAAEDDAERNPTPEAVLRTLAQVGLYERHGGVVPAWETPVRSAPRRVWVMAVAVAMAAGIGFGGYRYAARLQGERLAQAQELAAHVAGLLDSGSRKDLTDSEADFQRLFELDSRSHEAAFLWLKNRVLHTLLSEEPAPGIESALERARSVGVEEPRLVFGRLASALAAGDLPGAAQLVLQWDERAKGEALYQLLVGATFERAGNPMALERFISATTLQPDLKLAHLMAARLAVLQLGPEKAKPTLELAYARLGPGAAEQVLRGLAWASSSDADAPAPEAPNAAVLAELAPVLRATASAVEGVRAHREGHPDQVEAAFTRALGPTTAPALAAWIGYQALEAGDVQTARTAALKAMELSVQHDDSRALAARIALADGRLPEAQEAVRGLDPGSRDALLIEAVSAYENLQSADTARLTGALPTDAEANQTLLALRESNKVMLGQTRNKGDLLGQLSRDAQVWGPLVALDLALDLGELQAAEQILQAHPKSADLPAYAARSVRLRRYQGQIDAALERVRPALDSKAVTPRAAAEAVLAFVDGGRAAGAASTLSELGDKQGALGAWLGPLVDAARGNLKAAAKELTPLPLPSKNEPLLLQTLALRSLVAAKDRRAKPYYAQLTRRFPSHPEVRAAGKALGAR